MAGLSSACRVAGRAASSARPRHVDAVEAHTAGPACGRSRRIEAGGACGRSYRRRIEAAAQQRERKQC